MRLTPWLSLFSTSATRSKVTRAQAKRSGRSFVGTLESLEDRIVLTPITTNFYVDDNLAITNDVGTPGLSAGDTVTFANAEAGQTTGLIYGTNAFSSIQAAVTAASAGGTINVAAGTYTESVNVTKSLTIHGANAGIATGFNGGVRGAESVVNGAFDIYSAAVDTTIDGLQITGAQVNGGAYHGIRVNSSANNVTIVNNKIYGNNVLTNTQGIEAGAGLGSQIFQNNEIKGFASGIYVNPGSNVQVIGNYIHNVYAAVGNDAVTLLVKNNRIENATEGIGLGGSSSIVVQSNSFDFNTVTTLIAHYSGTNVVDASGNWWGSTDAAAIAAKMLSNGTTGTSKVDFSPYYNSGTDTDPSTPGFQGDVSNLHVTTAGAAATGLIQEAINLQNGHSPTITNGTVKVEAGNYAETLSGSVGTLTLATGAIAQLNGTLTGALDASAGTLVVDVTSAAAHDALKVIGTVKLGQSLTLNIASALLATQGAEIILIDNDGTDAVTGTFSNYADGAIVSTDFGGTGQTARISYTAGDGNDVGIRVDDPAPAISAPPPGDADPLTPDNFVVSVVGNTLQTTFNGVVIDTRPIAGVETLMISGNSGSTDTLTIDFSANPALAGLVKIVFDGGGDTHDELIVNGATGGSAMSVAYNGPGQGTIDVTGGPQIEFSGIGNNTLVITGTTDLVLDFSADDINIVFTQLDATTTQVSGDSFVTTTFASPSSSLTINFTNGFNYGATFTDMADNFNPTNGMTINGSTGAETVTITDLGDAFAGALAIDLSSGTDSITFTGTAANDRTYTSLSLSAETIDANAGGATLTVSGTTTLNNQGSANAISLAGNNNFNTVSVTAGGSVTLNDINAIDLSAATVGNALTVTSGAGITDSGNISVTNNASFSGTSITLGSGGETTNFGSLTFTSTGAVTIQEDSSLDLAGASTAGTLNLTATGAITDSGTVTVTGATSLTAGANSITLDGANDFGGSVTVVSGTTVVLNDTNAIDIAAATVSSTLTVTAVGAITDSGNISVTNNANFSGASITLGGGGETTNFGSLTFTSTGAVTIQEDSSLDLAGTNTAGTLNLTASGTITDSGTVTVTGTTSLTAGANSITLDGANDFGGSVTVVSGTAVTLNDTNAIDLAAATVTSLTVTAVGAVTDSGNLSVTNNANFSGSAITLGSAGETTNFGSLTFASAGAVTIEEDSDMSLAGTNTAGTLILTANGTITETGTVSAGATSLTGTTITLTNANVFGALTVTSGIGAVSITENDAIDVAAITHTGTLTLNAGANAITQTGIINVGTGATNLTGGAIMLNSANVLGDLTVNAGSGAVSITENDAIVVAGITHSNGDLTLQAGANSITVNGPINITTGDANFLTTTTLNLNNNVTATTILGTAITVNVNNNTAQIQDGVDAAAAGATVNVNSGVTFAEHVSVPKNLSLVATVNGVTINSPTANPALTVTAGTVNATGFSLTSTTAADTVLVSGGSLKLRNNFIVESSTATQVAIRVSAGALDLGVTASGDPGNNSITTSGAGTLLNTATAVDASGNWWGSSTFATITAGLIGTIDYSPYLNGGTDTSVAPGFQGDFSDVTAHDEGSQAGVGAITEAYQMLANTGTIHVLTGSYTESVDLGAGVNKAVTLSAGASPGQVQISGGLTFTSNDTLPVELNGTSTSLFDSFDVAGTVDLGNANLVVTVGYGAVPYDRFTIINKSSAGLVTGTFNGLGEGAIIQVPGGPRLRVSYIEFHNTTSTPPTPDFYGDGNDVSLTVMLPPILVTFQNGNLTLDGTGWNDDITLVFTGTNTVTVIGNDVTNFTGPGTGNAQLAGPYIVTGNIKVSLGNGNDKILIRGVGGAARFDSGNLTIDMGNGDDTVTTIDNALVPIATTGLTMTGNLSITGGAGIDTVTLGSIAAADRLTARNITIDNGAGAGIQSVNLDGVTATGNVVLTNSGTGDQSVTLGSLVANSITGGLTINQLASATSYTVGITDTSVGGNLLITNGSGSGAASVTIDTTAATTVGGLTQITNGNNLTNAVALIGTDGALRLAGNITVKNGNATTSNTITVTDLVNSGSTSSSFTNGSSPANLITFDGGLGTPFNTFAGVVAATNGNSTGTNVINATRLSSTKGINLTNGTATISNDVSVGGAGTPNAVSVTGNLVIANGASADINVDINNLTTNGANAVGDINMTNAASGLGGTTVTFGAIAANTISGNVKITNQASTGPRSVVIDQTTVNGRQGVNLYQIGAGNTSLTVGVTAAVTIANTLTVQDGNGAATVDLHQLTAGGLNYSDIGGGTDTITLANNAGGNLQVNGVTRIDTGAASDTVNIATAGDAFFNDSVFISLGAGNDLLFIGANADSPAFNGASKFQFDGGAGTDVFNGSPLSLADYFGAPLSKKLKSKILAFESLLTN